MEILVLLLVVALILGLVFYRRWLLHGIDPCVLRTSAGQDDIVKCFNEGVAVFGWKIVNENNPRVAQDVFGGQQIKLEMVTGADGRLYVAVGVHVFISGLFMPVSAHTLRIRRDRCVRRIRRLDPNMQTTREMEMTSEVEACIEQLLLVFFDEDQREDSDD